MEATSSMKYVYRYFFVIIVSITLFQNYQLVLYTALVQFLIKYLRDSSIIHVTYKIYDSNIRRTAKI